MNVNVKERSSARRARLPVLQYCIYTDRASLTRAHACRALLCARASAPDAWCTVFGMHGLVSLMVHSALPTLSQLADLYRTDKSAKHGHSYVGLYGMLLDPIRKDVRNVTEIGILGGSSLLMWADYFDRAQIWGMDIKLTAAALDRTARHERIHMWQVNAGMPDTAERLNLMNESMDLVVEDASHSWEDSHAIAFALWRLVKPGGFYVIEDINTGGNSRGNYRGSGLGQPGFASLAHNATGMLRDIFLANDVFFADTLIGVDLAKSAFVRQQTMKHWMHDSVNHNSHMIVIRKRAQV